MDSRLRSSRPTCRATSTSSGIGCRQGATFLRRYGGLRFQKRMAGRGRWGFRVEMARIRDPFSQPLINIVVDFDRIWRICFLLCRRDNATLDPIMDNPQADAISRANLADIECSVGK